VALAGYLLWLGMRRAIRPPRLFALYVAGYSGFRIVEERLRTDPSAIDLCLGGRVWFWHTQRGPRPHGSRRNSGSERRRGGARVVDGRGGRNRGI
jgi:hypothetical protein